MAIISPCRVCSAPAYDSDVCGIHSDARYSYALVEDQVFAVIDKYRGIIATCTNEFDAGNVADAMNLLADSRFKH